MKPEGLKIDDNLWKSLPPEGQQFVNSLWNRIQRLEKTAGQPLWRRVKDLEEQAGKKTPAPEPSKGGLFVLVADDSSVVRRTVGRLVEESGHRLAEAQDGIETFDAALKHQPDLIIMDVNMPNRNGLETLEALRQNVALRDIPVVMLTSEISSSTVSVAKRNGVKGYIVKGTKEEMSQRLMPFLSPAPQTSAANQAQRSGKLS